MNACSATWCRGRRLRLVDGTEERTRCHERMASELLQSDKFAYKEFIERKVGFELYNNT